MDDFDEAAWRTALERKGLDWVERTLRTRPGQPGDSVLDVVFTAPHPTREYCQRWCAEQQNRVMTMSPTTIGIVLAVVLVAVFSTMAISSVAHYRPRQMTYLSPARPPHGTNNQTDVSVPSASQNASPRPRSSCAYVTYQTADCRTSSY